MGCSPTTGRYDAAGNLNWRTNNDLKVQWGADSRNQLSSATRSGTLTVAGNVDLGSSPYTVSVSGTGLTPGAAAVYTDYAWARAGATPANGLNHEVRYVYDGRLVLQERNGSNTPQVTYTRGSDLSGSFEGAGGIGGLLSRSDASGHYYYHSDGNGNIVALMNSSRQVVARYRYDPFGNLLAMSGPMAAKNLYRFSSKEWHPNSGLYYYGYRFYEPNLQRWLNRDPLGEYGGINLYEFAYSAPMNWVDPWGERCWNPFNPEFWADLFGGNKKPAPLDPNSNRALLNEEGLTPGTFTDENGNQISGGKCTALVCGAVAAGVLTAVTEGLGSAGKAENLGAVAMKARKAAKAAEKAAEDAAKQFKKLSPGEIKKLKKAGINPHELKPNSKFDLFKNKDGDICVMPKDGSGPGDPTGININKL